MRPWKLKSVRNKEDSHNLSTIIHSENIYFLEYRHFVEKVILVMLNTLYL